MRLFGLRSWLLASCAAGVLAVVGCGQGNMLSSPTAPTPTVGSTAITSDETPGPAATASDAADEVALGLGGSGHGKDKNDKEKGKKDKGKGGESAESDDDDDDDESDGHRTLSGFVTAKGTDTLTVRGLALKVTSTTRIRHGNRILTFADIQVGDHVQARGSMTGTTLVATEVKVEDTDDDDDDDNEKDKDKDKGGAKVEGAVSGFSATGCPAVTFTVGTTKVTTTASTVFEHVTCATLANAMTVEAKGTKQTDGSILATKVEAGD